MGNLRGCSAGVPDERDLYCMPLRWSQWHDIIGTFTEGPVMPILLAGGIHEGAIGTFAGSKICIQCIMTMWSSI